MSLCVKRYTKMHQEIHQITLPRNRSQFFDGCLRTFFLVSWDPGNSSFFLYSEGPKSLFTPLLYQSIIIATWVSAEIRASAQPPPIQYIPATRRCPPFDRGGTESLAELLIQKHILFIVFPILLISRRWIWIFQLCELQLTKKIVLTRFDPKTLGF